MNQLKCRSILEILVTQNRDKCSSPALCNFLRFCSCAHVELSDDFRPLWIFFHSLLLEAKAKWKRETTYRDNILDMDIDEVDAVDDETSDIRVMLDMSDSTDTQSSSRTLLLVKSLGSGLSPISNCLVHNLTTSIRSLYIESARVLSTL